MNITQPAFPIIDIDKCDKPGISIRDYFAAKAMQAIIISPIGSMGFDDRAAWAHQQADAMIQERNK